MDFEALTQRLELEAQSLRETIAVANLRLSEIEMFLRLGKRFTGQSDTSAVDKSDFSKTGLQWFSQMDSETQRDRVVEASKKLLRDGRRRSTKELIAELKEVGVVIRGVAPWQTLSTYLSRGKEWFTSDVRKGGWTLKEFETQSPYTTVSMDLTPQFHCYTLGHAFKDEE